ncbi:hypothetical protein [Bradyrhizobium zhanjiangense]|uniref:hypothetical protein n=1 Tax=Bradyrhizobium zhanjiangense TaxID=1325107 RepID=UPI00100886CB|nr:hypothetical protein [Bradyrhizobium zhanjiangense]
MVRHFYQLRMGRYAEALVRRSKRETLQKIWLQYNLMQLGNEVVCSERSYGAAGQSLGRETGETETVPCALRPIAERVSSPRTISVDIPCARDRVARELVHHAAFEGDNVAHESHAAVDHNCDPHQLSNPAPQRPVWSTVPAIA